jgi:hypothetical protein
LTDRTGGNTLHPMIRRRSSNLFVLIPQAEHARVAAELVDQIGGAMHRPARAAEVADAIRLEAAGFVELDATPPLNPTARPAHFNELAITRQLHAWAAGSAAAETAGAYAGLLASIFSLQRSAAIAKGQLTLRENFEVNKHQHVEIERQQQLRPAVGLSNDAPMRNGLPEYAPDLPDIQRQLIYDYRLILLLQSLVLELCMHQRIFGDFPPTPIRPGGESVAIHFRWLDGERLSLAPWPFAADKIAVTITGLAVPAKAYDHELELHEAIASAPQHTLQITLAPEG